MRSPLDDLVRWVNDGLCEAYDRRKLFGVCGTVASLQGLTLEKAGLELMRAAVARNGGNLTAAAKELGIGKTTIFRKMRQA